MDLLILENLLDFPRQASLLINSSFLHCKMSVNHVYVRILYISPAATHQPAVVLRVVARVRRRAALRVVAAGAARVARERRPAAANNITYIVTLQYNIILTN